MRFTAFITNLILNIIFPPKCIFCGKLLEPHNSNGHITGEHYLYCAGCETKIPYCDDYLCCEKCGKPARELDKYGICEVCRKSVDAYTSRIISVFVYKSIVKSSILRYKLSGMKHYANYYSKVMLDRISDKFSDIKFDIITSVPGTVRKRNSKADFDHSGIIAAKIAGHMKVRYMRCLKKNSGTGHQRGLTYAERISNLNNNIRLLKFRNIKGKTILIIDDVCTTGSTIRECSKVLLRGGAKEVYAATLATVAAKGLAEDESS